MSAFQALVTERSHVSRTLESLVGQAAAEPARPDDSEAAAELRHGVRKHAKPAPTTW